MNPATYLTETAKKEVLKAIAELMLKSLEERKKDVEVVLTETTKQINDIKRLTGDYK